MREGCLIGCLGLIAVCMILAIVAVVALDGFFGMFREADRISLTEYYGQDHTLMALVEPDFDLVGSAVAESTDASPWLVDYVLPYEIALIVDVDRAAKTSTYTAAASLRRMAGFLSYYMPRGEGFKIFDDAEVVDMGVNSSGVVFLKAESPIDDDIAARAMDMNAVSVENPYTIEGGHLCQIALNNAAGNAFVALEEMAGPKRPPGESEGAITRVEREFLGRGVSTALLTFDTVNTETVSLNVRARLVEPDIASDIIPLLDEVVRELARGEGPHKTEVEGEFVIDGEELIGQYTITHVKKRIGDDWREAVDEFEQRVNEHFEHVKN